MFVIFGSMDIIFVTIGAALLSVFLVFCIRRYLSNFLFDVPNERSSHSVVTARGGGLGFVSALLLAAYFWAFTGHSLGILPLALFVAVVPMASVGLMDDFRELAASRKLVLQLFACLLLILTVFQGSFASSLPLPIVVLVTLGVLGIATLVNFYNFMDGIDGIIAGCAIVQFAFLGLFFQVDLCWIIVGALVGFLILNWHPAKIFMGDCGSNAIGALVGLCLFFAPDFSSFALAAFVTLPVTGDALYTLLIRLSKKENVFIAHKTHIYQRLHQAGLTHGQVSACYMLLNLSIAILLLHFRWSGAIASIILLVSSGLLAERHISNATQQSDC
jgi:UDP-N-acetylmuramyl pentapeptide phosphotransferase/UDP-N-acetylglucosamine-1-phosphate transferase